MIKVTVNAKVNITLFVTGMSEGYHALDSVVCSADLCDSVYAEKSDKDDVVLSVAEPSTAEKITRTLAEMRREISFGPVKIRVERNIPLGAGLGGSSASVAGTIRAVNELYGLNLTKEQMIRVADVTGSDNAFMLYGGAGKITDRSTPCARFSFSPIDAIIVTKGFSNTAGVFAGFDINPVFGGGEIGDAAIQALKSGDKQKIYKASHNVLTASACALNSNIGYALERLKLSFMSGSGSSVVSLQASEEDVNHFVQCGYKVYRVKLGAFETRSQSF